MRRLDRGGESEYLVNRARVRRLDVLELLSDTGLGREMHSVIGQGKVEEILLVEAARAAPVRRGGRRAREVPAPPGPGRVEARPRGVRARAGPRPRARGARARLRPLALQATAAERAAKLGAEIAAGPDRACSRPTRWSRGRAVASGRGRLEAATADRTRAEGRLAELARAPREGRGRADRARDRPGARRACVLRVRDGPRAAGAGRRRLGRARSALARAAATAQGVCRPPARGRRRGSRASASRPRRRPRAPRSRRAGSPRPTRARPPRPPPPPRRRWGR